MSLDNIILLPHFRIWTKATALFQRKFLMPWRTKKSAGWKNSSSEAIERREEEIGSFLITKSFTSIMSHFNIGTPNKCLKNQKTEYNTPCYDYCYDYYSQSDRHPKHSDFLKKRGKDALSPFLTKILCQHNIQVLDDMHWKMRQRWISTNPRLRIFNFHAH